MPAGHARAVRAGGGAGREDLLVEKILELGPLPLEGGRVHVGDVVRDHVDIGLLRQHAGRGDGERPAGLGPSEEFLEWALRLTLPSLLIADHCADRPCREDMAMLD